MVLTKNPHIRISAATAFLIVLFFSFIVPTYAMDVTLAWNASPGATGYKIYYKTGLSGPPYDGTGATLAGSFGIQNSPIDVGNTTQITLTLPDDEYRFVLTAYNDYGESNYSGEVSTGPISQETEPPDEEMSRCQLQKLRLAQNFCTQIFNGYSRQITFPAWFNFDLDAFITTSETRFESSWDRAEAMAFRMGDDCATTSVEYVSDIIVLAVEDMVQTIMDGINMEDRAGRRLATQLLRTISMKCSSTFLDRTDLFFQMRWNQAIAMADRQGIMYYGPSDVHITDMINAFAAEVIAELQ